MSKRKREKQQQSTETNSRDAKIVRACIRYAQSVAAFRAAFDADPDPNFAFAESSGEFDDEAWKALEKVAGMSAQSAEGINAKARIAVIVLDQCRTSLEESEEAFLRSFALDVRRHFDVAMENDRRAEMKAGHQLAA